MESLKLQFERNLQYQKQAVDAIVDIFKGQTPKQSNFTVSLHSYGQIGLLDTDLGVGNKLELDEDDILKSMQEIQLRNGLAPSKALKKTQYNFTVEMETGTGKTYVYLRTIFELNKRFGFSKFIIVVPSVAIKEGVIKSIEIMREHFSLLYDNVPFKQYEYKSKDLDKIREFTTSDNIRILIMTIQSFNKDSNIFNKEHEQTNDLKPLEFIRETNPVVIIDEPQNMESNKSKEAIDSLNPLCTLRYSATHANPYHMVYKLDAIDAYDLQLVKQIEVSSITSKDHHNDAYMKLISVDNKKSPITAKIEIDVQKRGKVKREVIKVKQGDDLFELSGGREVYSGFIINDIYCEKGYESVDFTSREEELRLGQALGDIDDDEIKRVQIAKTIEKHLDKELKLKQHGIKVLSLFFIDKVSNYRVYDKDGNVSKGKYALMFENEYKKLIKKAKYHTLFNDVDIESEAEAIHNGYFSQDKKGVFKDTNGNTLADEDIYGLIMKDKERLLSFDSKLKFIFSHSALREGWDNPNVFQICTLNETGSEMKKRQEIGRGLRLAVNQNGERIHGFEINTLTVMANESYEDFVRKLQHEISEEEGIKFGVVESHTFANIVRLDDKGNEEYFGHKASEELWSYLESKGYIDTTGKVQDQLRTALKENMVEIPEQFVDSKESIIRTLKKVAGGLNIKNADDKKEVKLNKAVFESQEFIELWDKIKYRTTYSVEFDSERLISECAEEIKMYLKVDKSKLIYTEAKVDINAGGIVAEESKHYSVVIDEYRHTIPDVVTFLQNETKLTRKTIVEILKKSGKLSMFKYNPQKFMDEVSMMVQNKMRHFIVDGIKYEKIGTEEYCVQELFNDSELYGYLSKNMVESNKSTFDHVIYDSDVEAEFAKRFEENDSIKVYAKLPKKFKIDTPLGPYNPDWAILIDKEGEQKLYFVLETKGNILWDALRPTEKAKIDCGYKHFKALGNEVEFTAADNFDEFIETV